MTLKSSVVIFHTLKPPQPQWPLQPHFIKKFTCPDGWSIPSTQMTKTSPSLRNGPSKIQFFTDILHPRCRRPLRPAYATFFWKLIDETQNFILSEPTIHHTSMKLLILLPVRADLLCTLFNVRHPVFWYWVYKVQGGSLTKKTAILLLYKMCVTEKRT